MTDGTYIAAEDIKKGNRVKIDYLSKVVRIENKDPQYLNAVLIRTIGEALETSDVVSISANEESPLVKTITLSFKLRREIK